MIKMLRWKVNGSYLLKYDNLPIYEKMQPVSIFPSLNHFCAWKN